MYLPSVRTNRSAGAIRSAGYALALLAAAASFVGCARKVPEELARLERRAEEAVGADHSGRLGRKRAGRYWEPSPEPPLATAHHAEKFIDADRQGRLLNEVDTYYSGKTYPNPDPDSPAGAVLREYVSIRYCYHRDRSDESRWECSHSDDTDGGELSLAEAESLLGRWGLKRLNY